MVHDTPDSPESQLVGGPIRDHPDRVARANPITYVTPDDPPFLIVHGDADPLVPHHQSELLEAALRKAGVRVKLVTIPGGPHGGETVKQASARLARTRGASTLTAERPRRPGVVLVLQKAPRPRGERRRPRADGRAGHRLRQSRRCTRVMRSQPRARRL